MRRRSFLSAIAAVLAFALPANAQPESRPFCIVVVPEGRVLPGHLAQVSRAMGNGMKSVDAELLDCSKAELSKAADPATGECREECEALMRSKTIGGTLVLVRVTTVDDRFVVRVSTGLSRSDSGAGTLAQLDGVSARIGRRLVSTDTKLVIEGGAKNSEWFVDGVPVVLAPDRSIKVLPGRRLVRMGTGAGVSGIRVADVILGDRVVLSFPDPQVRDQPAKALPRVAMETKARRSAPKKAPWTATAGIAVTSRDRAIAGYDGNGYSARFVGVGPEVGAAYRAKQAVARLEVVSTTYQVSTARFVGADTQTAHGGDSVRARGLIGYELPLSSAFELDAHAGGSWERHQADDPGNSGLLSSYQRASLETEIGTTLELGRLLDLRQQMSVGAHVGVSPWSMLTESPAVSGDSPRNGLGYQWRIDSTFSIDDRWRTAFWYRGETRATKFSGTASAPVNPVIERATIRESFNTVGASLGRAF